MSKIALITGVTGQDGSYLADFLLRKKGYRVVGITRSLAASNVWRLDYFGIRRRLTLMAGDGTDGAVLRRAIRRFAPHEIYHLAAQSSVAKSWEAPEETLRANALGVVALLEAVRRYQPYARVFHPSSVEIYGVKPLPQQGELTGGAPITPYGIAKLAAHLSLRRYRERYTIFACNGILFSHESPLRPEHFVSKKVARGVALIAAGRARTIALGNVHIKRNWAYAGDVVRAMWQCLQLPKPKDVIISTPYNFSVAQFAAAAFARAGIKNWRRYITITPRFVRPGEVAVLPPARAAQRLPGWQPRVNFKQLVAHLVDYELAALRGRSIKPLW